MSNPDPHRHAPITQSRRSSEDCGDSAQSACTKQPGPAPFSGLIETECGITRSLVAKVAGACVLFVLFISETHAATLWWDKNPSAGLTPGNGDWGTQPSDKNWAIDIGGIGTNEPWNNSGNDAVFQASGTSVLSVTGSISVNSMTFNGTGYTIAGTTLTMTGATVTTNVSGLISAPLAGTVGLIKTGTATLTLTGSNTFTGNTTISAGILSLGSTNALGSTTSVTVNLGATLGLSGAGTTRINDAAPITLGAGPAAAAALLQTNGVSENLGAMTLAGNSILDLSTGASVIAFANSSGNSWTGTLSIYNWSGNAGGGGTDQVRFGIDTTGLTAGQISQIVFYSDAGTTNLGAVTILGNGEVVPTIPEPTTWSMMLLGAAMLLATQRHRRRA